MATVPTFDTWSAKENPTAAKLNRNIRDAGNFWKSKPTAKVIRKLTQQALANGSEIQYDTVVVDTDNMVDLAAENDVINIKTAGWYLLLGYIQWVEPSTSVGLYREPRLLNNGVLLNKFIMTPVGNSLNQAATITGLTYCNVADKISLQMFHNAGSSLQTIISEADGCSLTATWNNG